MAKFRVFCLALARFHAVSSVLVLGALPLVAVDADPSWSAVASSRCFIAFRAVLTGTRVGAVDSVTIEWTLVETFVAHEAGSAHAFTWGRRKEKIFKIS